MRGTEVLMCCGSMTFPYLTGVENEREGLIGAGIRGYAGRESPGSLGVGRSPSSREAGHHLRPSADWPDA